MKKIKVMSIFGTRPEAVKMAPLVKELARRDGIESICCVTAQHREMLDSVLNVFSITPQHDLNIMERSQTLSSITCKALMGLEEVFSAVEPDLVLVHGDTSTTFAGALAAFYHKIPVGHVEAGLRTFDKYSPFPEEINRTLVSDIAELNFAPTSLNAENLAKEGIAKNVFITGNTVIDAMSTTVSDSYEFSSDVLNSLEFKSKRVIAVTCHRRENYGQPMTDIMNALKDVVTSHDDVELVYPVHLSPTVQHAAHSVLDGVPGVHLIDPLTVDEMHNLIARCYMVMTDSGGLQEEAPALGKPVLVLRRETERPEAVYAGTVKLAGVDKADIVALANELLSSQESYQAMAHAVNPYGDGHASERIADAIEWHFGLRENKPANFGS